ncbi:NAD(P)H-dependent oxidoreductase [Campylobacter geochelonis]|uniref:FMN dependent NADH:quinone oxidoreductase n=1 Tax=Campylobacter geochelonis TaxID=1780362 RepID=A0A128EBS3_9BACT|nr:NAD(P)H-dependent oxidoreductase [Campylobacter geochelonis]QKF70388.1 flavodoxin-like fold domain-containing protein, putative NAD(P)H (quinone) dehydrogenase/reductase [Campylobacter geochelonis]CZE46389.1 acyl carrier protein phosphodiesterase [Campylobacter geochelonis]
MKTLLINAHPKFDDKFSFSHMLEAKFKEKFELKFDKKLLTQLNLYGEAIPCLDKEMLDLFENPKENALSKRMDAIMEQFLSHKRVVIVMPLHNFNVTSRFKDYMDNILIAHKTFTYKSGGSVGLMNDDRKVLLLLSSGSLYTDSSRYEALDFASSYIKAMFCEMMGFNEFSLVRAEGTSLSRFSKEEILDKSYANLDAVFDKFYLQLQEI